MSQLTGYDVTTGTEPAPTTTIPNTAQAPTPVPTTTTQPIPTPTTTTAAAPQPGAVPVAPTQAAATSIVTTAAPTTTDATPTIKKNDPEPQNPLTQRFTTEEWTVLKDFRDLLPQIFEDSFPDDPKAKDTPITIWGVQIDPQNPQNAKVSVILMKFLRARNLNVNAARDMLESTLKWRKSFNVEAVMEEKFPQDLFGPTGRVFGKDKEGRPVMYNLYGAQDPKKVFADVQLFLRWRVSLQERLMQQLDFETIDQSLQIHDYAGVSITSRDANSKSAAQQATGIFQDHYPEVLYKKFFINVPTLLNWIFWAFKSMISANTLAKMSVVGSGTRAIHKALGPYIEDSQLPKRYGGAAEAF